MLLSWTFIFGPAIFYLETFAFRTHSSNDSNPKLGVEYLIDSKDKGWSKTLLISIESRQDS